MEERPGRPVDTSSLAWRAGDAFLPKGPRERLDAPVVTVAHADLNGWTLVHLLSGVIVGMLLPVGFASIVHVGWELYQIKIGMTDVEQKGEVADIAFDTIAFEIGNRFLRLTN